MRSFYCFSIIVISIIIPAVAAANDFQAGVASFKQGDFSAALIYFEAAKSSGNTSPQLIYNLASVHFKLARYRQSERYFRELISSAEWRDLALYNIGLIAEKSGNTSLAQHYFLQVMTTAENAAIRNLAQEKLTGINAARQNKKIIAAISVSSGVDDNAIAFADELQASSSAVSDSFIDYYAFGQSLMASKADVDTHVQGFVYGKKYQNLESLNVSLLGISVLQNANNKYSREVNLISSYIDGTSAYNQLQVMLSTRRSFYGKSWKLSYEPSYFDGGNNFNQLNGWQHRFSGSAQWRRNSAIFQLKITSEYNDRDDLTLGTSQYSYSPLRHSLSTSLRWNQSARLMYNTSATITRSDYSGENNLKDLDGNIKQKKRASNKLYFSFDAAYKFAPNWSLVAKFQHTTNNENFDIYTYTRNQYALGMECFF